MLPTLDKRIDNIIEARLKRQQALLARCEPRTERFSFLRAAVLRTQKHLRDHRVKFLRQVAKYSIKKAIPPSLPALQAEGIVKDKDIHQLLAYEWKLYEKQYKRQLRLSR